MKNPISGLMILSFVLALLLTLGHRAYYISKDLSSIIDQTRSQIKIIESEK